MATSNVSGPDIDNWNVPTIVEIDQLREQQEVTKSQFSEILEYSHRTAYHSALENRSLSHHRIQLAVKYFRECGSINYKAPTISEIIDAVNSRGISETHFSQAIGYDSPSSLGVVKDSGGMNSMYYRAAVEALEYYDQNGIIPLPHELDSLHSEW